MVEKRQDDDKVSRVMLAFCGYIKPKYSDTIEVKLQNFETTENKTK